MLISAGLTGCQEKPPWGNPPPPPGQEQAIYQTLQSIANGHTPEYRLEPAGGRGRWEDVEDALYWAVAEDGVQMAIRDVQRYDWGYVFDLKTIEGWPARLTVTRAAGESVFDAEAEVGRFPDLPSRRERAARLIDAFERKMKEFGTKRRPVAIEDSDR